MASINQGTHFYWNAPTGMADCGEWEALEELPFWGRLFHCRHVRSGDRAFISPREEEVRIIHSPLPPPPKPSRFQI